MSTLSIGATREILALHRRHGVALANSVIFLLRASGYDVSSVARESGYTRSTLYKAFACERSAPPRVREVVTEKIGVDPWLEHVTG